MHKNGPLVCGDGAFNGSIGSVIIGRETTPDSRLEMHRCNRVANPTCIRFV